MILVRNVFRLKFGKAREGIAALKETIAVAVRLGHEGQFRLLSDVTGDFYTLVLEVAYPDMSAFEQRAKRQLSDPQWRAAYEKVVPFVESGRREVFTVIDTGTLAGD
jgi:hypothetical protein